MKQHFVQGFWDLCASNPFARKLQGNAKEIFVLHAISVLPKEFLARQSAGGMSYTSMDVSSRGTTTSQISIPIYTVCKDIY